MIITTPNESNRNQLLTIANNAIPVIAPNAIRSQLVEDAVPDLRSGRRSFPIAGRNTFDSAGRAVNGVDSQGREAGSPSPLPSDFGANWADPQFVSGLQGQLNTLNLYNRRIDGDPGPYTYAGLVALNRLIGLQ